MINVVNNAGALVMMLEAVEFEISDYALAPNVGDERSLYEFLTSVPIEFRTNPIASLEENGFGILRHKITCIPDTQTRLNTLPDFIEGTGFVKP